MSRTRHYVNVVINRDTGSRCILGTRPSSIQMLYADGWIVDGQENAEFSIYNSLSSIGFSFLKCEYLDLAEKYRNLGNFA